MHIYCRQESFAQYIFSCISHSALDARKYDVCEKMKHIDQIELITRCVKICPCENVTKGLMRENLAARKYLNSQYMLVLSPKDWLGNNKYGECS